MANPRLDDAQKYRVSVRNFTAIDLEHAYTEANVVLQRYMDISQRVLKDAVKGEMSTIKKHCKDMEDCLTDMSITQRKLSTLSWQACRLHTFAPRGEVRGFARTLHFGVALFRKLNVPVLLLVSRVLLGMTRIVARSS